jgi:ABC-type multidrug transport system fused ATPase/permease subunit
MIILALAETAALGSIAFFASAVSDPEVVLRSKYIDWAEIFLPSSLFASAQALIITLSLIVIILVSGKNLFKGLIFYAIARFSTLVEVLIGERLLKGFLHLPYEWHLRRNTADLIYAIEWRKFLGRQFFAPLLKGLSDVLIVTTMLLALLLVQPLISLLVLIVLGGSSFFIYTSLKRKLDYMSSKCREYEQAINRENTKAIHGIKDVKVAKTERVFLQDYLQNSYPFTRYFGWQQFFKQAPMLLLESAGFIMLCGSICLMLLVMNVSAATITGTIALLAVTAWRILPALNRIVKALTTIRTALPYVSSIQSYFQEMTDHMPDINENPKRELPFSKNIKVQNMSFAYNKGNNNVLQNINFEISKGQTLGIIGTSGTGKSTLVDLLIGLLEPTQGEIRVDEQTLDYYYRQAWVEYIGYVPQSPYIYDGTLADNVAFGLTEEEIDHTRVWQCCQMAAMDFVHSLPQGIKTPIGERGVCLSGGQNQRVAIARALYHNPEVLIFDEATSSLDTASEKAIQKTIYSFKGKQTLIIIAHRLSTVEDCDEVIWLEKGEVRMKGAPSEVLPHYRLVHKGNDRSAIAQTEQLSKFATI